MPSRTEKSRVITCEPRLVFADRGRTVRAGAAALPRVAALASGRLVSAVDSVVLIVAMMENRLLRGWRQLLMRQMHVVPARVRGMRYYSSCLDFKMPYSDTRSLP